MELLPIYQTSQRTNKCTQMYHIIVTLYCTRNQTFLISDGAVGIEVRA